jgi:hypothetical protein
MSDNRRERRKLERDIQNKGGFSYTNVKSGTQLQYEPDTKSKIDPSIDETEIENLTNSIIEISEENIPADNNNTKFYEYKTLTLWDYVLLIRAKKINMNIKTNRPDVNKKEKKQGIVGTILKGNCLPCFCLCIRMINGVLAILVNDGGHRSRTFVEFLDDKFVTGPDTYYLNSRGKEIQIGGMLFSEILQKHPDIAKRFKTSKQKFDVYHHISPKEMTEEFQDRNQSSDTNHQEGNYNCHSNNLISEVTRNITRIVEGENSNPHKLFRTIDGKITEDEDAIIGFKLDRLNWDTIVGRTLAMLDNADCVTPLCGKDELEELIEDGCLIEAGRFTKQPDTFTNLVEDVDIFLDNIAETLKVWPSVRNDVPKNKMLITALSRFLFHMEYHYFKSLEFINDDYPEGYKFHGIKDYSKFAKKIHTALFTIFSKDSKKDVGRWKEGKSKGDERTISNAMKGYLGHYTDPARIQQTIDWMMEQFDNDFEAWGFDVRDAVRLIPTKIINQRYFENDHKCECCNRECDDIDLKLEGAHNIPHVAGVQAGGCSSTKENARAGCYDCNRDMKERVFEEYKESGEWKKFLT